MPEQRSTRSMSPERRGWGRCVHFAISTRSVEKWLDGFGTETPPPL